MSKLCLALLLLANALPAAAVNKCVESSGRLIFTDLACPAGTQGPTTPVTMPRAASAPPAGPASAPAPAPAPVPAQAARPARETAPSAPPSKPGQETRPPRPRSAEPMP